MTCRDESLDLMATDLDKIQVDPGGSHPINEDLNGNSMKVFESYSLNLRVNTT